MASIWQITLSGYDAQAASESGQSATGKIALGTWGSYGHETIQVTLAEPWDVCTLVTATFWPTYPPDHWDTPGIRVALGTDGLLTVPPEATNRPTQTGRVVFEGLADNEKIISADVRYTVRDHAPTGGTESTATPSLLEQLLTQTGSNAQVAAQSADAAAKSAGRKRGCGLCQQNGSGDQRGQRKCQRRCCGQECRDGGGQPTGGQSVRGCRAKKPAGVRGCRRRGGRRKG